MGKTLKILSIITGLLMVGTALALMLINPMQAGALPAGFRSPIIALEFMQTTEDLAAFFDVSNLAHLKSQFILGNQVDYAFMTFYSLFAFLCGWLMYIETRVKALWLNIPLCILVWAADMIENFHIQEIISMDHYANASLLLEQLHLFTWLKWGGLSAIMLLYAMYLLQGNWWKKLLGIILAGSFGMAIPAFLVGGVYCELLSVSIVLSFICLFIFAVTWRTRE